jgi:hypothetical protein
MLTKVGKGRFVRGAAIGSANLAGDRSGSEKDAEVAGEEVAHRLLFQALSKA